MSESQGKVTSIHNDRQPFIPQLSQATKDNFKKNMINDSI